MPTDLRKPAHGPSRTLKSGPRRTPEASPSTLRAALGSPEELPGAAKPRICKRLQREHQLRPPSQSTWNTLRHPAPPVDSTMFRRSLIEVLACPFSQASPRAGPAGSADSFWGAGRLGGWGLGASGFDGPTASRTRPEPCPPSIRKRCACGFPQGTAEPLRHASKKYGRKKSSTTDLENAHFFFLA